MRTRALIGLRVISVFALITVLAALVSCTGGSPSFVPGEDAPDFSLRDSDGHKVKLSDFKGKVVLLNFWATWCGPCVSELPALQRLSAKFQSKGLVVLGVGVDDEADSLANYRKVYGLNYATAVDVGGATKRTYKLTGVPESFFIDRDGKFILISDPETNDPTVRIVGPRQWDTPNMFARITSVLEN